MRGKSTLGGAYHRKDSAGIDSGLTKSQEFDSGTGGYNDAGMNNTSSAAGQKAGRKGQRNESSVSEKGKSLKIC